jgi:hypothetical protein
MPTKRGRKPARPAKNLGARQLTKKQAANVKGGASDMFRSAQKVREAALGDGSVRTEISSQKV